MAHEQAINVLVNSLAQDEDTLKQLWQSLKASREALQSVEQCEADCRARIASKQETLQMLRSWKPSMVSEPISGSEAEPSE
jgi:hypothetical protein